jgi:hypothetical protein
MLPFRLPEIDGLCCYQQTGKEQIQFIAWQCESQRHIFTHRVPFGQVGSVFKSYLDPNSAIRSFDSKPANEINNLSPHDDLSITGTTQYGF